MSRPPADPSESYADRFNDTKIVHEYRIGLDRPSKWREALSLRWLSSVFVIMLERRAIRRLFADATPDNAILDVPCGSGKLLGLFRGDRIVVGADTSIHQLRLYLGAGGSSGVQADLRRLPFKSQSFGMAVCLRLLHRLSSADRTKCLRELHRVSTDWGIVYYSIPGKLTRVVATAERVLRLGTRGKQFGCSELEARREICGAGWLIARDTCVLWGVSTGRAYLIRPK